MSANSVRKFQDLLLNFSQAEDPELRGKIEKTLWDTFGEEQAVFVLDMSGFTRLTRKFGIIHYLSMVRRMQLTSGPIVQSYAGYMLKYDADNCFALFPKPLNAVNAAIAMQHSFEAANILTSDDLDIRIACGIDYGKILVVGSEDCFGDAVNRASKLGEDIAEAGDILVTKEAMSMISPEAGIKSHEIKISISGVNIDAFSIDYRAD